MTAIFKCSENPVQVLRIKPNTQGRHAHLFGGVPKHSGIAPEPGKPELHLLYTFDLSDSRLGISLEGVRFLPLFFGFSYDATWLSYRMVSDEAIKIVFQEKKVPVKGFPYPDYPGIFSEVPVDLIDQPLEPMLDREDPYNPFHKEVLSRVGPERTRKQVLTALDPLDQIAFAAGLPQGPSRENCDLKGCSGLLEIFCVIDWDAVPGVRLWDDVGEGEDVKIVYETCPACSTIHVTTQCT